MKKILKEKKESAAPSQNKRGKGRRPTVAAHRKAASRNEAEACERALDRLLAELVCQEHARRR